MKISKTTWWIIGGVTLTGVGIGSYFLFFKDKPPKTNKYGNQKVKTKKRKGGISGGVKTLTQQGTPVVKPNWNDPFDPVYVEQVQNWLGKKIKGIEYEQALKYAKQIKKAKGFFDDDEKAVNAIFSHKLKSKVEVAQVAQAFLDEYERDMYDYIESFADDQEDMDYMVNTPVRKLPNYIVE